MSRGDETLHAPSGGDRERAPVALVYSPHAGSAGRAEPVELLHGVGLSVADAIPIAQLAALDPAKLVERWRQTGVRAVVAAGGDGSVGTTATIAGQADLPLGILPLGTSNDVARALALPVDPTAAARLIAGCLASGEERLIDAGELVPTASASASAGSNVLAGGYFLHALTLGLNVEFARLATDINQRLRWGRLTYVASALESLSRLPSIPVTLTVEGLEGAADSAARTITANAALLTAINLPVFGGWMQLRLPTVREDDRLLDFILIEALAPLTGGYMAAALERLLTALTSGEREARSLEGGALPGGRWFRARSVTITTPTPVEITLDGELRGRTPAAVRIAPRAARILAPHARVAPRATLEEDSRETATDVGQHLLGQL
jgi:diacylglycerol kinase (ATP)